MQLHVSGFARDCKAYSIETYSIESENRCKISSIEQNYRDIFFNKIQKKERKISSLKSF